MANELKYFRAGLSAGPILQGYAILSALAAIALASPSHAANPKPDVAIKTKAIEGGVYLDDKIKADPALTANCLAEGTKWLEDQAAEAADKLSPQLPRAYRWDLRRQYSVRSVVGDRYVSIVRADFVDIRMGHPNTDVNTMLWDKAAERRISIQPFFVETADNGPTMNAMLKAVIASLEIEKGKRNAGETATAEWFGNLEPQLLKIGAVTLAPSAKAGMSSGLTFHYPRYVVGPYVEGEYVAFVPWAAMKPFLTVEGLRIFGGSRPRGDEDDLQQLQWIRVMDR